MQKWPESVCSLTGAAVGSLMKDAVRRVIASIHASRFDFLAETKGTKSDGGTDWVTNADKQAQSIYVKLLREWFPTFGIIAEEDNLSIPCTHPILNVWFTVDPLDGTSAFVRGQSHGIGTMLSLMVNNEVVAVCVGDILTGEIYSYRPDSDQTHRIDRNGLAKQLEIDRKRPLLDQYILLRDPVEDHDPITRFILQRRPHPIFKSHEITGGSIGISMARLWKGEVGAAMLRPGFQTPWDTCPVIGISQRLGFLFYACSTLSQPANNVPLFELQKMSPMKSTFKTDSDILIVHETRIPELMNWCDSEGLFFEP